MTNQSDRFHDFSEKNIEVKKAINIILKTECIKKTRGH